MATLQPFPALRFNPRRINGPLASVVAPPYDVISWEDQDRLHKKSPHNVIRLILSRQYDGDGPGDNRYTRAAKTLQTWLDDEVLVEDAQPAFYVYEQTFETAGGPSSGARRLVRRGVLGALQLEPFGEGCVFPHEETFSAPKADRLNLVRECRANLSPVFGLVTDADSAVVRLLARATAQAQPDAEVTEESGVLNRLWVLSEPEFCEALRQALAPRKVFIADGHHRYETACTYRNERRAHDSQPGSKRERAYDSVLMMLVPVSDPGLNILPTHRLVQAGAGFSAQQFLSKSAELFERQPATEAALRALAGEEGGPPKFGLVLAGGGKFILAAQPGCEAAMARTAPDRSAAWRGLDVAVLHELILRGLVGLNGAEVPHKHGITYTKEVSEVFARMAPQGEFDLGFVLRPTRIEQVRAVAEDGERMPQKSTYFYPKLLSGLVMRKL